MIEAVKSALTGQFEASLTMLEDALRQCPDDRWETPVGDFPFWHAAYHALFYTDLYLTQNLDSFTPQEFHRENYQYFGQLPPPECTPFVASIPYSRETLLEYTSHCLQKASEAIAQETVESLNGPCGFWWYSLPRLEFHLNNIRHVQHHAAQLSLRLRRDADIDVAWVGRRTREG